VEPVILDEFISRLISVGALPNARGGWAYAWPDMHTPSEKDKAEVAVKRTEALAKYSDSMAAGDNVPLGVFLRSEKFMDFSEEEAMKIERANEERAAEELAMVEKEALEIASLAPEAGEDEGAMAAMRQWAADHKKEILRVMRMVRNQEENEDGPALEDWAFLLHHIHIDDDGEEVIHHCPMLDHLGNKFELGHMKDEDGKIHHALIGLLEDQEVLWSDREAEEEGHDIPCPDRQL